MGDAAESWESDVVLADGGTVHVRPIRPDDAGALVAFHGRLSPESIYFRFFSPKPRLTDKEVEKFTTVDMVDRVALVAELGDDVIAVARYDRWPGRDEAEVAFTVDDAHHGRGIATLLLEHLAAVARSHGLRRFTAEVLPDNRPMLGVFRRAGFEVHNEFSGGVIDVAFDIEPTLAYIESVDRREQRAESRSIARLLRPRSVAVIGASDRLGSVGREVFRNLLNSGFEGPVYPVNPTAPHVASVPAYDSVLDIPDDVHLAVVAVPAEAVPGVIAQCAQKRVRGAIVVSTGFADAGPEGAATQRAMVELARRHGMRIIGPASLGVINTDPTSPLHASFAPRDVPAGHLAVSLQSGPLGAGMIELAKRLRRRPVQLRLAREQGRRQRQRPPQLLVRRPGHRRRAALHRELRQPAQVRPRRPARVASQAGRGGQGRAGLGRRRRRRRAVPAGRRDPGRHRAGAVRRRPGAGQPAAARRRPGGRRHQRPAAPPCWPSTACGPAGCARPSCRSTPGPSSATSWPTT